MGVRVWVALISLASFAASVIGALACVMAELNYSDRQPLYLAFFLLRVAVGSLAVLFADTTLIGILHARRPLPSTRIIVLSRRPRFFSWARTWANVGLALCCGVEAAIWRPLPQLVPLVVIALVPLIVHRVLEQGPLVYVNPPQT
jgi:hypothetical protein